MKGRSVNRSLNRQTNDPTNSAFENRMLKMNRMVAVDRCVRVCTNSTDSSRVFTTTAHSRASSSFRPRQAR